MLARDVPRFAAVGKQQAVERDIAIVVSEQTSHADVMRVIGSALSATRLRSAVLFDVFRPKRGKDGEPVAGFAPGEKSFAVRLALGDGVTALTDAEIDESLQAVLQKLEQQLGARLR